MTVWIEKLPCSAGAHAVRVEQFGDEYRFHLEYVYVCKTVGCRWQSVRWTKLEKPVALPLLSRLRTSGSG